MQVFKAIDKAETRLGFVHHDLRIQNIMEHRADAKPLLPKGFASKSQRRQVGLRASNEPNVFRLPGRTLSAACTCLHPARPVGTR